VRAGIFGSGDFGLILNRKADASFPASAIFISSGNGYL